MKGKKGHLVYGLMAGMTLGLAVWGSVPLPMKTSPVAEQQARTVGVTGQPGLEQSADGTSLSLQARAAVLMDGDSGRVLYAHNADSFYPMASTTKIMTCILALENGSLDDVCTFSADAASQPKVHLGAPEGSRFYLRDLLAALMLESDNDAAVAIAEQVGGSVGNFARMMNQKAQELGCTDTWFITPNGLDAEEEDDYGNIRIHGTTATDLARMMRYCISVSPQREEFLKITQMPSASFSALDGASYYSCTNHNALLSMMDGALSGKTGFTGNAGYCYVGALKDQGRTYVIALLGSGWPPHKNYKWADARKLFAYGIETFRYRDASQRVELPMLEVKSGVVGDWKEEMANNRYIVGETIKIKPEYREKMGIRMLLADNEEILYRLELPKELRAPVREGQVVGYVVYELNGETIRTDPLYAAEEVAQMRWYHCFYQAVSQWKLPKG